MSEGGVPAVPVVAEVVNPNVGNLKPLAPRPGFVPPTESAAVKLQQENFAGKNLDAERTPNNKITPELKQKLDSAEAAKRLRPFWERKQGRQGIYDLINTNPRAPQTENKQKTPDNGNYSLSGAERNKSVNHTPLRNNNRQSVAAAPVANTDTRNQPRNPVAPANRPGNQPRQFQGDPQYQLQEIRQKPKGNFDLVDSDGFAVKKTQTARTEPAKRFQLEDRKPGIYDLVDEKGKLIPRSNRPRSEQQSGNSRSEATRPQTRKENSGRAESERGQKPQSTVESRYLQNRMTEWNRTNPEPQGDPALKAAWENRRKIALDGFKDMALTHALEVQYEKTIQPHPGKLASREAIVNWMKARHDWISGTKDTAGKEITKGQKDRILEERAKTKAKKEEEKKKADAAKAAPATPQPQAPSVAAKAPGVAAPPAAEAPATIKAEEKKPAQAATAKPPEAQPATKTNAAEKPPATEAKKETPQDKSKTEGDKTTETEASKERAARVQKYIDAVTQKWDDNEPEDKESPEHDLWEQGKAYAEDQAEIDANAFIDLKIIQDSDPTYKEPPKSDKVAHNKWVRLSQLKRQQLVKKYEAQGLRDLPIENNPHVTVDIFKKENKPS